MSEIAVRVEGLWKGYSLGKPKSVSMIESIRTFSFGKASGAEDFWALRDVNFQIERGKAVGIIGKNGAGKSTLLKILSRITYPTKGSIEINGRVSSLLEVGTGFHPELTGRENVFLNGTLLGMKRKEVKSRFDEIVDFSGVEKFIDTPVKHYSSGMKVRLAFAVAAHLDPDILIIDEVLAVGDVEFQQKCLGKMGDVTGQGRTVLFVSHNLAAVRALCQSGLYLDSGSISLIGSVEDVLASYSKHTTLKVDSIKQSPGVILLRSHPEKLYKKDYGLQECQILVEGQNREVLKTGDVVEFLVKFKLDFEINFISLGFLIKDSEHRPIIGLNNLVQNKSMKVTGKQEGAICIKIDKLLLYRTGVYTMDLFLHDGAKNFDVIIDGIHFKVEADDVYSTGKLPDVKINAFFQPGVSFNLV